MKALKGKLGLGDSFQCRQIVPKPQGPLDENNKVGTNLYGLSPSELMFVAIRFQGGDSSSRCFKVTEAVQQLQFVYEAIARCNKANGPNSTRQYYLRDVETKHDYREYSTEMHSWFPQQGALTATLVEGIYNRITVDLFDKSDAIACGQTVGKGEDGVEHFSADLWTVLTANEKKAVLPEEESVLKSASMASTKTNLFDLRIFIGHLVGCPFFQAWLIAIFDDYPGFRSLSVPVSRKTFFRLKGDYAKSLCMAVIYKE